MNIRNKQFQMNCVEENHDGMLCVESCLKMPAAKRTITFLKQEHHKKKNAKSNGPKTFYSITFLTMRTNFQVVSKQEITCDKEKR